MNNRLILLREPSLVTAKANEILEQINKASEILAEIENTVNVLKLNSEGYSLDKDYYSEVASLIKDSKEVLDYCNEHTQLLDNIGGDHPEWDNSDPTPPEINEMLGLEGIF